MIQDVVNFIMWIWDLIGIEIVVFLLPGIVLQITSQELEKRIRNNLDNAVPNSVQRRPLSERYLSNRKLWGFTLNILLYASLILKGIFGYIFLGFLGAFLFTIPEIMLDKTRYTVFTIESRMNLLVQEKNE